MARARAPLPWFPVLLLALLLAACGEEEAVTPDGGVEPPPRALDAGSPEDAARPEDAASSVDAGAPAEDASTPPLDAGAEPPPGAIAPDGANPGEAPAPDGEGPVTAARGRDAVLRVTSAPGEHLHFFLAFRGDPDLLELSVERFEAGDVRALGVTDAGRGLRTLAIFDPGPPRTYWVRVHTDAPAFDGTLTVTRTPFEDGPDCEADCDRLLQLPLPIDPALDGYATAPSTVFRYQFGRRDLVMMVRSAGQRMARRGLEPFVPEDLSQWDGETPGVDVGAPRHASHRRGRDVDVSIYGTDGRAPWRSYCRVERTSRGRECLPGTVEGYDGALTAQLYGGFLRSGRVTMSFLDAELIDPTVEGAVASAAADALEADLVPLYSDGVRLQHWPNHDNHLHVRVAEHARFAAEAFAAP